MPFENAKGISDTFNTPILSSTLPVGKNYLLLIAIDKYPHFTPLNNCVRDAKSFSKILVDKYNFLIYKELYDEDATRMNLDEWMTKAANDLKPEDSLLVYFSGHGTTFGDKGAWVMANAELGKKNLYYTSDFLRLALEELSRTRHILIITDSCFSDRIINSKVDGENDSGAGIKSRAVIASGRNVPVPDGEPGEHSPFANILLEEFENAHKPMTANALGFVFGKKIKARYFTLQGDEGADFIFTPTNFNENLPDAVELRDAFFSLAFGNCELDFSDNFSAEQHFFNLLVIQGQNERAGHLMIAKKLIRTFVQNSNGSPHFDAVKFEFGNIALPIQKPWDALANALGVSNLSPEDLTKHLAAKIKSKNLVLYIELKNTYDERLISDFWLELNQHLTALPEQQYSVQQHFKLFLFLLDKRSDSLRFDVFPSALSYTFGIQLADIEPLPLKRIINWKIGLKAKPNIFKPSFEKIDLQLFAPENFFAENLVLNICDLCNLDKKSEHHPYKYIFEQHQTM